MKPTNIKPEACKILISEPSLHDFYFYKSVVLLAEHNREGSFGLVLNKPIDLKLNEIIEDFPYYDGKIYLGGPVSPKNLFYLHTKGELIENSLPLAEDLFWGGNIEDVKMLLDSQVLNSKSIRFFIGYAGWSANQLEEEIAQQAWLVSQTNLKNIIFEESQAMWKKVLKELGDDYALWSNFPVDLSLN